MFLYRNLKAMYFYITNIIEIEPGLNYRFPGGVEKFYRPIEQISRKRYNLGRLHDRAKDY
jgi:hypothetical protein